MGHRISARISNSIQQKKEKEQNDQDSFLRNSLHLHLPRSFTEGSFAKGSFAKRSFAKGSFAKGSFAKGSFTKERTEQATATEQFDFPMSQTASCDQR